MFDLPMEELICTWNAIAWILEDYPELVCYCLDGLDPRNCQYKFITDIFSNNGHITDRYIL